MCALLLLLLLLPPPEATLGDLGITLGDLEISDGEVGEMDLLGEAEPLLEVLDLFSGLVALVRRESEGRSEDGKREDTAVDCSIISWQ